MATRQVLADLAAAAVSAGLPAVDIESVGGVDAARRVREGEQVDLVFLAEDALAALARDGHVDASSVVALVVSDVVAAVPANTADRAKPTDAVAFADAEAMRSAIASADRIGYSTGPSGSALLELIAGWGLTEAVRDRLVQAKPGIPVAQLLARGDVDLGFQQLSELAGHPGVRILGVLPPGCAITTVFAGAVATASSEAASAQSLLDCFSSDSVIAIKTGNGFRS